MRILTLTYPLTPVSPAACGGTEQVAFQLLRGLARDPEIAVEWIGAAGSDVGAAGVSCLSWSSLLARYGLDRPPAPLYSPAGLADLQSRCNRATALYAAGRGFDLIHNQGAFFAQAAAQVDTPVLFTLHLARRLYPSDLIPSRPPNLHFQCVSHSQRRDYGKAACCGVIPNGIDLDRFSARLAPPGADAPLLYLGRICPEKGAHLAIAIARRARRRLWLVGGVAPFPSHQRYFQDRILPQLDAGIRYMPTPPLPVKQALLAIGAAVVIPSLIEETSSLVAMEAAASGVPTLALDVGALAEVVADGETGWLADTWEALAEIAACRLPRPPRQGGISSAACRARAERRFCARRMLARYRALYRRLAPAAARLSAA